MHKTHINLTLNLNQFNYKKYDLRVPVGLSIKELLHIVVQAHQLSLKVIRPSVRVQGRDVVLTALQRLEDVDYLYDGIELVVELV